LKALPISSGSEDLSIGGIQGKRRLFHHLARSQIDVEGSVTRCSNQSHFACRRVVQRMALRWQRSDPCALLTSAAAILHTSFHQASPLLPYELFLAKNLSHVTCVRVRRSVLARIREGTSEIKGRGNLAKACFHSCSIWSSMIQPGWEGGEGGGVKRGSSTKRAM
jgi:hypothetical protein